MHVAGQCIPLQVSCDSKPTILTNTNYKTVKMIEKTWRHPNIYHILNLAKKNAPLTQPLEGLNISSRTHWQPLWMLWRRATDITMAGQVWSCFKVSQYVYMSSRVEEKAKNETCLFYFVLLYFSFRVFTNTWLVTLYQNLKNELTYSLFLHDIPKPSGGNGSGRFTSRASEWDKVSHINVRCSRTLNVSCKVTL